MDWTTAIITALGSLDIIAVIQLIRYRHENKTLKENEVKVSSVDAQKAEIDLAELYKDKVLDMLDQLSQKQDAGNGNQERMLAKLDILETEVGNMKTYLDGPYSEWLKGQRSGGRRKGAEA